MGWPSQDEIAALDELVSTMRALGVCRFKLDALEVDFFPPQFAPPEMGEFPAPGHGNMDVMPPEDDDELAHVGFRVKQPEDE